MKGYEIPGMMRERGAHKWTQRSIDFSDDILGNTKEYKYQQKNLRPDSKTSSSAVEGRCDFFLLRLATKQP